MTVFVVSEQVLNDLERFCTTLIKKEFFFERRVCFGIWSHCLTVLVVCERALNNWKRFDTNLVNKLFVTTFYLVFGHEKQFLTVFSVFSLVFDRFSFFLIIDRIARLFPK